MRTQRLSSRQSILDAASAIWAQNPGASTREIALFAGVGRATLHRHFPHRADLLKALADDAMAEIDAAIEASLQAGPAARDQLEAYLKIIVPRADRSRFLWSEPDVMNDPQIREGYARQLRLAKDLVARLKVEGSIAADVPDSWVVSTIDTLTYAAWSSVQEGHLAPRSASKLVLRTILRGLG
ncbi:MAG: TetR/AcrR family transcriptional regulator [Acidobacteriota bacterium]